MRTTRSFPLPGILTAASAAGAILFSGCTNGLMIYSTKKLESGSNVPSSMNSKSSLFSLKNTNRTSTRTQTSGARVKSFETPRTQTRNTGAKRSKLEHMAQPANKSYTIRKGDTLSQIALDHKVGIFELASLNNMDTKDTILAGKKLTLPLGAIVPKSYSKRPAPKNETVNYYTVQKGDYLGKIALKTKTSVSDLRKWNNLKNDNLHIGWKLTLGPGGKPKISTPTPRSNRGSKPIPASGIHIVKPGESISSIATQYKGLTTPRLKAINGLSSNRIIPGQELKLRGDSFMAKPTNTPPRQPDNARAERQTATPRPVGVPKENTTIPPTKLPHFVDQQNDTLKSVADMYGSKIEWITLENGIQDDADLRSRKEINVPVVQ